MLARCRRVPQAAATVGCDAAREPPPPSLPPPDPVPPLAHSVAPPIIAPKAHCPNNPLPQYRIAPMAHCPNTPWPNLHGPNTTWPKCPMCSANAQCINA